MSRQPIYGAAEFAKALNLRRGQFAEWRKRGDIPAPAWRLSCGDIWSHRQVQTQLRHLRERGPHTLQDAIALLLDEGYSTITSGLVTIELAAFTPQKPSQLVKIVRRRGSVAIADANTGRTLATVSK